ncbi:MAG TPA: LysE family translocator [Spirochaetota bacterium]|nr:LysE family translocator [Spirochaetota bacterium]HPJ34310.1 LysE family translocator [Spirochaetota bacterium]
MSPDLFIAYTGIVFLATIIPGPNMLLALNHGANHGVGKALYSGLGNLIGNLLMALASLLGLGIILLTSAIFFNIIKWIGVVYLIFIGIKMIITPVEEQGINDLKTKPEKRQKRYRFFIDGFVIAISNPKGIIFFTALFPQFINVNQATVFSFLIVFFILGVIAFTCYMVYAVFGVKLNKLFQIKLFRKSFNCISGSLMIVIGLTLSLTKRSIAR